MQIAYILYDTVSFLFLLHLLQSELVHTFCLPFSLYAKDFCKFSIQSSFQSYFLYSDFRRKMGSRPQLVYWDVRGLCEPIRYVLRYLSIDFEDKRLPMGAEGSVTWTELKQSEGLDFPNLPYYIDGDLKLSQSLAILRHVSRKHNLYGDTEAESATLDMIEQYLIDLKKAAWVVFNDKRFHEIKEDYKKTIPTRLGELEKFMEGKNFILGSKISGIDFLLYEAIEWFRILAPEVFKEEASLQNLENFHQRIESIPQIKEYINSDKYKDWPLFGPVVYFGFSKDPEYKPLPFSYKNWVAKYPLEP